MNTEAKNRLFVGFLLVLDKKNEYDILFSDVIFNHIANKCRHRRGDAMNTNTKNKSQTTQKPYPYNVTRNEKMLKLLIEGYKLEKTVLRLNEHEIMVADVTLVRGKETKVLTGIFGKDTPAGRAAIRQAEEGEKVKAPSKKTRVGKTARERANGTILRHEKNKKDKGLVYEKLESGKNTSSAERAGLGKGQGKKDHKK